jgi:hypothetical protein
MNHYTVLLLYPDHTNIQTYQAHVKAKTPKQAIFFARFEATKAEGNEEMDKEDFMPLAIYEGHLEDLNETSMP